MLVTINGDDYRVNNNEFQEEPHKNYTKLLIRKDIGFLERIISLINELSCLKLKNLIIYNTTNGGFIPINCSKKYDKIFLVETQLNHINNILENINKYKIDNVNNVKYLYNVKNIVFCVLVI